MIKEILKKWKVILLIVTLVLAVISIHPNFSNKGVAIRTVVKDSAAYMADMRSPLPTDKPMFRDVIKKINDETIRDINDYNAFIKTLKEEDIVEIDVESNYKKVGDKREFSFFKHKEKYTLAVKPLIKVTQLNETEEKLVNKTIEVNKTINGSIILVNETVEEKVIVPRTLEEVIGAEDIGLKVYDAPTTNIKKGLDLEGGTRVLLVPETEIGDDELEIVMDNLKQRLNVYGLSDIIVRSAGDFVAGNKYIVVEIAGANEEEVKELIGKQGKFEAKIENTTVFRGGQDIKSVCRTPDCSYAIDPRRPCGAISNGMYQCTFSFAIALSKEAAERQAEATKNLDVISEEYGEGYLSKNIDIYLDDELVDSLKIGAGLKGKPETNIAISGPGTGRSRQEAVLDSANNMKRLQTILITGSLPVKLNIVKTDTISPLLGKEFINNAITVGLLAILAVGCVVYIRYRKLRISIPVMITMISEIILILGMAVLIGWQLDLVAIAGIIVAIGTGVDQQIVIIDETRKEIILNWKDKVKRAFFIIMASYSTVFVAMLPLMSAGAGLLKGFAITTLLGVSFGVFVTRSAFAVMLEVLQKE